MMRTMGKKVIIRDIAQAANVSITTVSHALSGKGRLPATTRERVRQIQEKAISKLKGSKQILEIWDNW